MLKKRVLRTVALILLLCLVLGACSCGKGRAASEILSVMCERAEILPAGQVYQKGAEEGQAEYLSPAMCASLYGDGDVPAEMELMEDYAIYLSSFARPFELAVFAVMREVTPIR